MKRIETKLPKDLADSQRDQIVKALARQFETNPKILEGLKKSVLLEIVDVIHDDYEKCKVENGKMVGVVSAQSLGEKLTQGSLNSFHFSGISAGRASFSGLGRLQELLGVVETLKNPSLTIYLKKNYTGPEIRRLITKFQYTVVHDLVSKYVVKKEEEIPKEIWHEIYEEVFGKRNDIDRPPWILRLFFDKQKLYDLRITLKDVSDIIESNFNDLRVVFSGLDNAYMDIYHDNKIDTTNVNNFITPENALFYHLRDIVWPSISALTVSGVKNISKLYPTNVRLSQAIKRYVKHPLGVKLDLDTGFMSMHHITLQEIQEFVNFQLDSEQSYNDNILITDLSPKQVKSQVDSLYVNFSDIVSKVSEKKNSLHITLNPDLISHYRIDSDDIRVMLISTDYNIKDNNIVINNISLSDYNSSLASQEVFSLMKQLKSEHWYYETEGTNLEGVFSVSEVYQQATVSNNLKEIYETLGIEAARQFLVEEFMRNGGDAINSAHVTLLADTMTYIGIVIAVTRHGQAKQNIEFLARSNFEENTKNFLQAAGAGETDNLSGISASIITGKLANIGSNAFDVVYSPPIRPQTRVFASRSNKFTSQSFRKNTAVPKSRSSRDSSSDNQQSSTSSRYSSSDNQRSRSTSSRDSSSDNQQRSRSSRDSSSDNQRSRSTSSRDSSSDNQRSRSSSSRDSSSDNQRSRSSSSRDSSEYTE